VLVQIQDEEHLSQTVQNVVCTGSAALKSHQFQGNFDWSKLTASHCTVSQIENKLETLTYVSCIMFQQCYPETSFRFFQNHSLSDKKTRLVVHSEISHSLIMVLSDRNKVTVSLF
jgi:hypothetical protein